MMPDEIVISGVTYHRQTVTEEVFNSLSDGWPAGEDGLFSDWIQSVSDIIKDVPDEFKTTCQFEQKDRWGDEAPSFRVFYHRPETDAEFQRRANRMEEWRKARIAELKKLVGEAPDA